MSDRLIESALQLTILVMIGTVAAWADAPAPPVATAPAASAPSAAAAPAVPPPPAVPSTPAAASGPTAASAPTSIASPAAASAPTTPSATGALPTLHFSSSIAGDEIYDVLKASALFSALDKEKPGSPIGVRVSHIYRRTAGGTASGLMSAILTGGSLGLIPAVTNRDLSITYELVVNGSVVTRYSYQKNLTRVFSIYSTDRTHGLGDDGLAWVTGTAREFAAAAAHDPKVAALEAEYHYYYDPPRPESSAAH